jgi:hypothetical protein
MIRKYFEKVRKRIAELKWLIERDFPAEAVKKTSGISELTTMLII